MSVLIWPRVSFSETRILNILIVFKNILILSLIILYLNFVNFWAAQYSDMKQAQKIFYSKVHTCLSPGNVMCSKIMQKYYFDNSSSY